MKILMMTLTCFLTSIAAQARTQTLECSPGAKMQKFTATLDDSTYDAGSGYFSVKDAEIRIEYATAKLMCTGYSLQDISCVGFWFDLGSEIVNVTVSQNATGLTSMIKNLTPAPVTDGSSWKCVVR